MNFPHRFPAPNSHIFYGFLLILDVFIFCDKSSLVSIERTGRSDLRFTRFSQSVYPKFKKVSRLLLHGLSAMPPWTFTSRSLLPDSLCICLYRMNPKPEAEHSNPWVPRNTIEKDIYINKKVNKEINLSR